MFDKTIERVEKRSFENIPVDRLDYVGDGSKFLYDLNGFKMMDGDGNPLTDKGLIYCGKCHQLKQTRIYSQLLGRILEPFCLCSCQQLIDQKERQRIIDQNRKMQIERNLKEADSLMLKNTFSKDRYPDNKMHKISKDYCKKWLEFNLPKNIGLYICGPVGVGKTFYASCIANEIAKVYAHSVKATSINKIINDLFSVTDKSGYIADLVSVDLLVIDDLGTERKTGYAAEQVFSVIDERYKTQKPLIITSNISYDQLSKNTDIQYQRINDRIRDMCVPIVMEGQSLRGLIPQQGRR